MRVLFQGAGAIGIAGAALFTDSHDVAVVSRRPAPRPRAAYPRRVSALDPSGSEPRVESIDAAPIDGAPHVGASRDGGSHEGAPDDGTPDDGAPHEGAPHEGAPHEGAPDDGEPRDSEACDKGPRDSGPHDSEPRDSESCDIEPSGAARGARPGPYAASEPSHGWSATRVASTRRVTVTDWDRAREAGPWDLIVLSTRPGDLDPTVASAIRKTSSGVIAITSQVDGDLDRARAEFPGAEVVVFAPAFLSERVAIGEAANGREVRYWAPSAAPRFLVAGRHEAVRRVVRGLGRLVTPVPQSAVVLPPTVFIPFVAELSISGGSWAELKNHLPRPSRAAAEAVRARTGLPVPVSASVARIVSARIARTVLETMERLVPIDVTAYAGRHFGRHVAQTRDMLAGWAADADSPALQEQIAALDSATSAAGVGGGG